MEQNNDKWDERLRLSSEPLMHPDLAAAMKEHLCVQGACAWETVWESAKTAEPNLGGLRLLLSRYLVSLKAWSWTLVLVN